MAMRDRYTPIMVLGYVGVLITVASMAVLLRGAWIDASAKNDCRMSGRVVTADRGDEWHCATVTPEAKP
jgi:hypothetical protein